MIDPRAGTTSDEPTAADGGLETLRARLQALYSDLDHMIVRLGPRCELSGRCCRFLEFGHTLFLSSMEARLLVADAPPPVRPLDAGATCPWQDAQGRCSARTARPLGCRVYFCDPSYEPQAAEVSEPFVTRLKRLAEELNSPWHYAPLHTHLREAQGEGRVAFPSEFETRSEPAPS